MCYYTDQLNKLATSTQVLEFPSSVKFFDGKGNNTSQMDLNKKSIDVFIEYLKEQT